MKRWFVTVVWLLSLALPLQGLAASTGCLAGHRTGHGVASMGEPAATALAAPCHPGHGTETTVAIDTGTCDGCAACASCHGGATLPPAPTPVRDITATAPPAIGPDTAAPAFITAGPERPPRTRLA